MNAKQIFKEQTCKKEQVRKDIFCPSHLFGTLKGILRSQFLYFFKISFNFFKDCLENKWIVSKGFERVMSRSSVFMT